MTDDSTELPAETFDIDDLETLKLLTAEPRIEILELLRKPASVAQLAEYMDVPRTRLYHHINTLEEIGAITVAEERRAGAMTEKLYQVAAKTYKPSEKFLETATPREQAAAIIDSLYSITRSDFVRAAEQERIDLAESDRQRPLSLARRVYTLTPERATELVTRMESLLTEYNDDEESEDTRPFAVLVVAHPSSRSTT